MIELNVPGRGSLSLNHLVCDVEGTLAVDGRFRDDLFRLLTSLQDRMQVHLVTADIYGQQHLIDHRLKIEAVRIKTDADLPESEQKKRFVEGLGADQVAAVGQGADDAGMLETAALGICVASPEGIAVQTLLAADLVVPDIIQALELLTNPLRIVNTLRT